MKHFIITLFLAAYFLIPPSSFAQVESGLRKAKYYTDRNNAIDALYGYEQKTYFFTYPFASDTTMLKLFGELTQLNNKLIFTNQKLCDYLRVTHQKSESEDCWKVNNIIMLNMNLLNFITGLLHWQIDDAVKGIKNTNPLNDSKMKRTPTFEKD